MFAVFVAVHIAAGLTSVVSGGLAAAARKRPGRHPRAGTGYVWAMAAVFITATVLSAMRWSRNWYLFVVAAVAVSLTTLGWYARRRRWYRWMLWHGTAMSGSYIALLTGFYVDNGPRLPLWNRLPPVSFWFLPALVGIPLVVRALVHNGALRKDQRRRTGIEPA